MKQFVLFCVLNVVLVSQAKHMDRCALATELLRHGFPQHQLKDWVCLVEAESSGRTDVIGPPNSDGSRDHGLFQINDRYWCNNGSPGKECNVKCEDLRTDDISAAAACVKKIYGVHGFNAWYGWKNKCENKQMPDLNNCIL